MYRFTLLILLALYFNPVFCLELNQKEWKLTSPDERLAIHVRNKPAEATDGTKQYLEELSYFISFKTENGLLQVIDSSPLGINRKDYDFSRDLTFLTAIFDVIDENYQSLHGKKKIIRNHCNQITLAFQNPDKKKINLVIRAFNDGIAFRYTFPETDTAKYNISNENTGFCLPSDGHAFIMPYAEPNDWGPAYEQYYNMNIGIGTSSPSSSGWSFPALFQVQSGKIWILLTEAGLNSTYCGTHLAQDAPDGLYRIQFPDSGEGNGYGDVLPSSTLPWSTPWRVINVSGSLAGIVESTLIEQLSEPPMGKDYKWVKPGRASWSWWSDGSSPKDFNKLAEYIDFAAEMGWEYSLVDANWNELGEKKIRELAQYANQKSVGLFLWYNSGGPNNKVTEQPRDRIFDRELRRKEYKFLNEAGIKGVKIDFFHSDKQERIKQYLSILEDACEFQLLVNFHGCTLPRGWSRTYPHLLSMEAVKGAECYGFDKDFPEKAPSHNTILPFVRNVVGPMDYTPVTFSNDKYPHQTSFAHELALSVVFESGLQHFADASESYAKQPKGVIDFLKMIPTSWDEIKFIDGYPGKFVIIARRDGHKWFISGINGENNKKTVEIDISFVSGIKGNLVLIEDGDTNSQFSVSETLISPSQKVKVQMLPFGGFSAVVQ
jgi:hypothetical protein